MKPKTQQNRMSENDVAEYMRKAFGYDMQTSSEERDVDDGEPTSETRREIPRMHEPEE